MVVVEVAASDEFTFTAPRRLFSASTYRPQRYHFGHDVMPDIDASVMIRGTALGQVSQRVVIRLLVDRWGGGQAKLAFFARDSS